MAVRLGAVVTEVDRGWGAIRRSLEVIKAANGGSVVLVGVLGDKAEQQRKDGITNAELATIHEFGAPGAGIPERSFLRSTFDEHLGEYHVMVAKLLRNVIERRMTVSQALGLVGIKAVADVRKKIRAGIPPPLKAATIAAKGSSKPLIDTGQLVGAIDSQVVINGVRE